VYKISQKSSTHCVLSTCSILQKPFPVCHVHKVTRQW